MAFGFFKKKVSADIIYMNGHIYTQDAAYPWASAVACKDGEILAVGDFDAMDEITSEDTEIFDLNDRYMFPGFIDAHSASVLHAFEDSYLKISNEWDVEPIMDLLADYIDECDHDVIFGYGFHERILDRFPDARAANFALDELDTRKPIILLGESGVHCWTNSVAAAIIRSAAEDDEVDVVTTNYALNVLSPLPLDILEEAYKNFAENAADQGFTSLFNMCAPDYFTSLYMDSLLSAIGEGEGDIKQRFHGATYVNGPLHPQLILRRLLAAKTSCVELDGLVTADFAKLDVAEDEGDAGFSQEALNTICLDLVEHGFNIHLDAKDQSSYDKAVNTFTLLRNKGYRNQTLSLASQFESDADYAEAFSSTWSTDLWENSLFEHVSTVEEAIDALTIGAAELIGKSKELGSIEKGKRADFVVFDGNPLNNSLERFANRHVDMTILDGNIVYDAEESAADEMCGLLFSMQL